MLSVVKWCFYISLNVEKMLMFKRSQNHYVLLSNLCSIEQNKILIRKHRIKNNFAHTNNVWFIPQSLKILHIVYDNRWKYKMYYETYENHWRCFYIPLCIWNVFSQFFFQLSTSSSEYHNEKSSWEKVKIFVTYFPPQKSFDWTSFISVSKWKFVYVFLLHHCD